MTHAGALITSLCLSRASSIIQCGVSMSRPSLPPRRLFHRVWELTIHRRTEERVAQGATSSANGCRAAGSKAGREALFTGFIHLIERALEQKCHFVVWASVCLGRGTMIRELHCTALPLFSANKQLTSLILVIRGLWPH